MIHPNSFLILTFDHDGSHMQVCMIDRYALAPMGEDAALLFCSDVTDRFAIQQDQPFVVSMTRLA